MFSISLNPTYLCNFRCDFCYLTEGQLADSKKLSLKKFEVMLKDICSVKNVSHIDLYGGEIHLLPEEYLDELHSIVKTHTLAQVNVVTNLSKINNYFLRDDVSLSVSYDFECRQDHAKVLANILSLPKDVAILMLASPQLMKKDINEMANVFNSVANIGSVEIKPYSTNQANQFEVDYRDYESFVTEWIKVKDKHFQFMNETHIKESLVGANNAFSDDHVYITPSGKFGVLEFDENDHEYFLELNSFHEYLLWAESEKQKVNMNGYCKQCEFKGRCLTEHYREVVNIDKSCNGYYNLIKDYERGVLGK